MWNEKKPQKMRPRRGEFKRRMGFEVSGPPDDNLFQKRSKKLKIQTVERKSMS